MQSLFAVASLAALVSAAPAPQSGVDDSITVDTTYPYTGPAVPIGDWVDQTVNGNGMGFPRLVEPPAVQPYSDGPTNNINVIQLSWVPGGMNVHFQTPFGIGGVPCVYYGTSETAMNNVAKGATTRCVARCALLHPESA